MPWAFIIPAAASLIGGSMQADAARGAAGTTAAATREQTALQRRMYEENVARQRPFYEAGVNALPMYLQGIQRGGELVAGPTLSQLQFDPGYAFRLQEGIKALDRSAAARGGLLGGNQLRGVSEYGQGLASQEFGNAYNRFIGEQATRRNALAGLVGQSQTTANTIGTAGQNMASNVGNLAMQQATNQANANLTASRAMSSAYGDAADQLGKIDWGNLYSSVFEPKSSMDVLANQQYPGRR